MFFSLKNYINYLPSQENIDCCTASSSLLAAEILFSMNGQRIHLSRLFLYYMTRKSQDRIGQKGAELSTALETFKITGACTDKMWPFLWDRVDREPHQRAIEEAVSFRLTSYENSHPDLYKEHLRNGYPIVVGMLTGKKFWSLKGTLEEQYYLPVSEINIQKRGHAVTVIGFDDSLNGGSWIIANSLGLRWGHNGYAAIPYSCNIDLKESYAIKQVSGIGPGQKFLRN